LPASGFDAVAELSDETLVADGEGVVVVVVDAA
jgi:hypothetical protein